METRKAAPPPPAKKTTNKISWEPFQLPGINVPLKRVAGPRRDGVPPIDPNYYFREDLVRELQWAVWPHDGGDWSPMLLVGPKGSGKTSLPTQVAAHCNIVVHRTNLNVGTTVRHLKGRVGAEEGSTVFIPGIATMAMEEGSWLVLDEISGATPPVALCLFPILEPRGEVLLEDAQPPRYVRRHEDFRIFATDNTIGAEQEDSRFAYAGTNPEVNEALLDRFGALVQVGYLSPKQEHTTIMKIVGCGPEMEETLEGMCRVAQMIRESPSISTAFSMRMLIEWSRRVVAGTVEHTGKVSPYASVNDNHVLQTAGPAFLDKLRSRVERAAFESIIRELFDIRDTEDDKSMPKSSRS